MNSDKLTKQNDGIYFSLIKRNIPFDRTDISGVETEEEKLSLLKEENERLKKVINDNKPPPQPKKEKQVQQPKKEKDKNKDEGDDDVIKEKEKKFSIITNMEDIKRAFFGDELELFKNLVKEHNFKYYIANYKYNSDKDGAPDFSAKNLIKGFCNKGDKLSKYFMSCFRCFRVKENYEYTSLWIVNTEDSLEEVAPYFFEEFEFIPVENDNIELFLLNIEKKYSDEEQYIFENKILIAESYIH